MDLKEHKAEFSAKGYTIIPGFIPEDTAKKLKIIARADKVMAANMRSVKDSDGRESKLTLWYSPGDDVFGRLSCSALLNEYMSCFLGGDVSFFHAKLMNKEPKVGGKWEWHQDYGYWHDDGFPRADMGSCFVALDPCTEENGALRVIPESHKYGRLDHGLKGQQAGADMAKVTQILDQHKVVLCEMSPGDALFFHANTLHASGPNTSDQSRLILISSFFRRDNESTQADPRYRNKDVPSYPHDTILDGAKGLDEALPFSDETAHIIEN